MPNFGLIGFPIGGSLSPLMFNAAYNGKWDYDLIEDPSFESAWRSFVDKYDGVNVTAPYKEMACTKADILEEECRIIGATNLLVKRNDGIHAYNSDYRGVLKLLEQYGFRKGGTAVIVGYGGAGKAAAAAAHSAGLRPLICNRTASKAPGIFPLSDVRSLARDSEIVIYTPPCGIEEMRDIQCRCLLEANYRTPSLSTHRGIDRYIHGREWMLHQAIEGYGLLTGITPDRDAMISQLYKK